ncbi:MAG: hypothetical protein QXH60_01330 [Candidatus Pacearchaeota archaeon]
MHQKRQTASNLWPIPRKGTKFVVVPSHNKKNGIPILIVMRDILGIVKTKKELKKIITEKKILTNGSVVRNVNFSLTLFDTISFPELKKHYKINLSELGKFSLSEIKDSEALFKISKAIGKKILKGGKIQINFSDGRNLISNEKINIGDSAIINIKTKKIDKILPIKENSNVIIIKGKHLGKIGKIKKIYERNSLINLNNEEFILPNKFIMVIS